MSQHIRVFCANKSCEDTREISDFHFCSSNPIDWMMQIGSPCFSTDFFVPCVCMECASIDSKNIVGKKFVRCSSCQKKMSLLGEFSEEFPEESGFIYHYMIADLEDIEIVEIGDIEMVEIGDLEEEEPLPSKPNLDEFGDHYRLALSGHTCPRCKEQTLTFEQEL